MDNSEVIVRVLTLGIGLIVLLVAIAIPIIVFFAIKHLIKFTARTIYEEKAKAENKDSGKN